MLWCLKTILCAEPYAIMPPLELFMEVSYEDRRNMFYRDVERGDAVIGRINNIRDFGFFLTLICMGGGLERDIEDLELSVTTAARLHVYFYFYTMPRAPIDGEARAVEMHFGKVFLRTRPSLVGLLLSVRGIALCSNSLPLRRHCALQEMYLRTETMTTHCLTTRLEI